MFEFVCICVQSNSNVNLHGVVCLLAYVWLRYEPRYEKTVFFFAYTKTKTQIRCAVTAQLISAFVFATRIKQSLYFLFTKFQAYSHLVWLYTLVCIRPGRKPRRPVFSQRGSYQVFFILFCSVGALSLISFSSALVIFNTCNK